MTFGTVINCMDGRVQKPVSEYLQKKFNAEYIDVITEPGPNLILSKLTNENLINSINARLDISVNKHDSKNIAIVGHHDCAGNPSPKESQLKHISDSIEYLQKNFPTSNVIGLWVNENWEVEEV